MKTKQAKAKTTTENLPVVNSNDAFGANLVFNGLADALFGFGPQSPGAQLSQTDTLFHAMRWYLITNMRQPLSEAYAEIGLIQTIIDIPVDDGLRGGIEIKTKQLSEDQITQLKLVMELEGDLDVAGQAVKWNRLFGGAGVIAVTDTDYSQPLDIKTLKQGSKLAFKAADLWELFSDKQNIEGDGAPLDDALISTYNYYSKKVHKSRVMTMKGLPAPSLLRPRLRGWGLSVVEVLIRSINNYLKASDLGFEVLDEFKLDIFKIKNLAQTLMSPQGSQKVRERVALANQQKNYQNALVMDAEDDYMQKQLSWSGLGDAMAGFRAQIASDMRIPQTKLFGQSAAGFNSGEDDIEVYNGMVESQVRTKSKHVILKMLQFRCQVEFGMVPTDLMIEFPPLRVLSSEQLETVKTQKFDRALRAKQAGEIDSLEFREIVNRGNLLDIQLDTSKSKIEGLEESRQVPPAQDQNAGKDETDEQDEDDASDEGETKTENSLEYDVKSFEIDGGIQQFDAYHERDLENPDRIPDRDLVAQAKAASMKAFGKEVWQFVFWYYKQHGGKVQ